MITVHRAARDGLVPAYVGLLIGLKHGLLLLTCGSLGALSALIVTREAEHIGQILAKLSCSGETSLGHAGGPAGRGRPWLIGSGTVACIHNIILTVVEALSAILGENGRVRSWSGRDH